MKTKQKAKLKKPENIFLAIGVIFCLAFSIFQPLFIEPDASFHFDQATYLADVVVDRGKVGMPAEDYQSTPVPFTTISNMKREGTYFKNLFETKLSTIPKNKVADQRVVKMHASWLNDAGHWIPAVGVKIGYMIYPSIGAMIITARLLSSAVFLIALYFIIKKVKAYKSVFVVISLTPTMIQIASSLSYDCFNYIAFSGAFALLINLAIAVKNREKPSRIWTAILILFSLAGVWLAKANSRLLVLLFIALAASLFYRRFKRKLNRRQLYVLPVLVLLVLFAIILIDKGSVITAVFAHPKTLTLRMFYTLLEPYYTVLSTEVISGTNTIGIPAWLYPIQFMTIVIIFLTQKANMVPRWFTWASLSVAALNFFGILTQYALNKDFSGVVITGPQGRYFTPFLLLIAPALAVLGEKMAVNPAMTLEPVNELLGQDVSKKPVELINRIVFTVSAFTLLVCLVIIMLKFYHLQLPADEYRSGFEHYIFK